MESTRTETANADWFGPALVAVAGFHAVWIALVWAVASISAGYWPTVVFWIAPIAAIIAGILFGVFGGLAHVALKALTFERLWAYLLAAFLSGVLIGEASVAFDLVLPVFPGMMSAPGEAGRVEVDLVCAALSCISALIAWGIRWRALRHQVARA